MSQKLSRTINLPRVPDSFDENQRRFFDDYNRAITEQFRDLFDLLGVDKAGFEKHLGDTTAHKMTDSPSNGLGVLRTADGKVRFKSADGTEPTDDYGVTFGAISPYMSHIQKTDSIHGATSTPTGNHIALYDQYGRLQTESSNSGKDAVNFTDLANRSSAEPSAGKIVKYNTGGILRANDPVNGLDVVNKQFLAQQMLSASQVTPLFIGKGCSAVESSGANAWRVRMTPVQTAIPYDQTTGDINLPAGRYLVCVILGMIEGGVVASYIVNGTAHKIGVNNGSWGGSFPEVIVPASACTIRIVQNSTYIIGSSQYASTPAAAQSGDDAISLSIISL